MSTTIELSLGPDVVQRLLPHRRPFLMVDRVESLERGDGRLRASRAISSNEPVFEGHFPGLHLWPGVYTIEGMGQTTNLLLLLLELAKGWEDIGRDAESLFEGLRNLERGCRLEPGFRPADARTFEAALAEALPTTASRMGMSAAVDVKLLAPVFAGDRLDYTCTLVRMLDDLVRFDVEAAVRGRLVARGVMTGKRDIVFPGVVRT